MSYHDLSESTLSLEERQAEAIKIDDMLMYSLSSMTKKEKEFVLLMGSKGVSVSVKQLYWMRDLLAKY